MDKEAHEVEVREGVHPVELRVARAWKSPAGSAELKDDQQDVANKEASVFEDLAQTEAGEHNSLDHT